MIEDVSCRSLYDLIQRHQADAFRSTVQRIIELAPIGSAGVKIVSGDFSSSFCFGEGTCVSPSVDPFLPLATLVVPIPCIEYIVCFICHAAWCLCRLVISLCD